MSRFTKSVWIARVFALNAMCLRNTLRPDLRRLAERYRNAALYLYSRTARIEEPTYELVNDNEPW